MNEGTEAVMVTVYCKTWDDWNKLVAFINQNRSQYDYEEPDGIILEPGDPFTATEGK